MLDYYEPEGDAPASEKCARSGAKARRGLLISIEDRRARKWRQQAASLGDDRIRYLSGKRLRDYSPVELGKFQIITDVFGGFSYTEDLSRFVDKVLSLLEVGGGFYTLVPGVHLEDGKDKLGVFYLTELENAAGRSEKVCSSLKDYLRASHLRIEERLEKGHRADKHSEGLHQHLGPAHEISGVQSGISSRQAIPIGAVGCAVEFTAPVRDEQKKKLESLEVKV